MCLGTDFLRWNHAMKSTHLKSWLQYRLLEMKLGIETEPFVMLILISVF